MQLDNQSKYHLSPGSSLVYLWLFHPKWTSLHSGPICVLDSVAGIRDKGMSRKRSIGFGERQATVKLTVRLCGFHDNRDKQNL